jgi:hypothetical protein
MDVKREFEGGVSALLPSVVGPNGSLGGVEKLFGKTVARM